MYDPIMRVLTLLELLQARDHVSGAELAQHLEVDLRTVQRYIVRLRDLGIPIAASPGVGGSYRLRPGYRLPPLLFTNEEAFALSLGLRALHAIGLAAFAPATRGALAKLSRVLPESLRGSLRTLEDVITVEPGRWVVPTSLQSLLDAASAIRLGRRIRFRYQSQAAVHTQREVEPWSVLHADDRWYLIGHCLTRNDPRTFRLDRVTHLETTSHPATRPENFDPRAWLAQRMTFLQSEYRIDVWIDMPIQEAEHSFALWRTSLTAEGGGTRLRCGRDQLQLFAAMLLTTGRRIVIHSPPQLRETFRTLAAQALQAADEAA